MEAKLLEGPCQEVDIDITKNYDENSVGMTVRYQLKSLRKQKSQDRRMGITRSKVMV